MKKHFERLQELERDLDALFADARAYVLTETEAAKVDQVACRIIDSAEADMTEIIATCHLN